MCSSDLATPAADHAAPAPPAADHAAPAPPADHACTVEVVSQPAGAEVVGPDDVVLGTTPAHVPLPCGAPITLAIRKARLVTATRTLTPAPDSPAVRVALVRPTFSVRVSSTPPGATITLNGRSLGVTPTTVRVPAFEASTLTLTKDGYAPEAEQVAPRSNGLSVHAALRRVSGRR